MFIDASGVAPGSLPDGFTVARTGQGAPAAWAVQEDASVPSRRVISQTSTDRTDYRFPLAIYEKLSVMDLDVKVHFKAVGGRVDRAGRIAVRLVDPNNYYVVRANALEDNVNFYHVVEGTRRQIRGASTKVTSDVWHTLGIAAERQEFTISFDGKSLSCTPGSHAVSLFRRPAALARMDGRMVTDHARKLLAACARLSRGFAEGRRRTDRALRSDRFRC